MYSIKSSELKRIEKLWSETNNVMCTPWRRSRVKTRIGYPLLHTHPSYLCTDQSLILHTSTEYSVLLRTLYEVRSIKVWNPLLFFIYLRTLHKALPTMDRDSMWLHLWQCIPSSIYLPRELPHIFRRTLGIHYLIHYSEVYISIETRSSYERNLWVT